MIRSALRNICWPLFALCLAGWNFPVRSQEMVVPTPETKLVTPFSEIFMAAPRMTLPIFEYPASASVAEQEIGVELPPGNAAKELLEVSPGIRVVEDADGGHPLISIRGEGHEVDRGIKGIKVLLDGIPLSDPSGLAPDLHDLDWPSVEKAEILRGPLSALYGGSSPGGVLNITTRESESPKGYQTSLSIGSDGFWGVRAEGGERDLMTRSWMSASRFFDRGYRDHSSSWGTNFYGKWRMDLDPYGSNFTGLVSGNSSYGQIAGGISSPQMADDRRAANSFAEDYDAYTMTRRITGGFTTRMAMSPEKDISASVYYKRTDFRESVPSSVIHRDLNTPGAMIQYNYGSTRGYTRHYFSTGYEMDFQLVDEYKKPNIGGGNEGQGRLSEQSLKQYSYGLFVLERVQRGPWGLFIGLRRDRVDNRFKDELRLGGIDLSGNMNFSKTTGKIGLTWCYSPSSSLYANWGDGFAPPSTDELLANPARMGGFNWRLHPTTSRGSELGARGLLWNRASYDVTLFYSQTKNEMERYAVEDRPLETFARNAGEGRRSGIEASLSWRPTENLSVRAAYTYCEFKYTSYESTSPGVDYSGNRVPDSPRHLLYADAAYNFGHGLATGLTVEMQGRAYIDASNETWAGGYTLVNPRLSYGWNYGRTSGDLFLQIRNLFGVKHIASAAPDTDGYSYNPAPTRQIFLGVRLRFHPRR